MPYPTQSELKKIYAKLDNSISRLIKLNRVDADNLRTLDRLGRCRVAAELWAICTKEARAALLTDEHHHVRSTARLSA